MSQGQDTVGPLSELESALSASTPRAREQLASARRCLAALQQRLDQALQAGASPSDFAHLTRLMAACQAGARLLHTHPQRFFHQE